MLALNSPDAEIAAVRRQVADMGVNISVQGVNRLTKAAAENRKVFEFAKKPRIPCITADANFDAFDNLDVQRESVHLPTCRMTSGWGRVALR
ncbi:MAG: hypothetical protein RLZZ436_982 [Planctomycetota bacterium]|jgi:hypothetical protein